MKNTYTSPEMEVITFENEDVITTSGVTDDEPAFAENGTPVA